ncbi:MAG: mechanosensitive ion channel [Alistipes sp.]|nr:mechanosensitive ion channel [Alistipes sp.]
MENWRTILLNWLHIDISALVWYEQLAMVCVILLIIAIVDRLSKFILNRFLSRLVRASKAKWDDILLDRNVLNNLIAIIPAILLVLFLPFVFVDDPTLYTITQRLSWIYLVAITLRFVLSFFSALAHILESADSYKDKPIRGTIQMLEVLFSMLAVIIMISIAVNKSPVYLLTGLGASAAILMLVFQDLILGLVAGIQLSANKMMQVGDWVVVKDKGIDGFVIEITLTTVKIRNWDYTISTIQPQALVNGSFVNWSNVFASGGRRIARAVNIDIRSIRFLSDEELQQWADNPLLAEFITETQLQITAATERGDKIRATSLRLTNLTLLRRYMHNYIMQHPAFNKEFISLVRLLEPTPHGQPMQIYFFSNDTAWVNYEDIQARVFEYLYAIAPEFGINIFQSPSGEDIQGINK